MISNNNSTSIKIKPKGTLENNFKSLKLKFPITQAKQISRVEKNLISSDLDHFQPVKLEPFILF